MFILYCFINMDQSSTQTLSFSARYGRWIGGAVIVGIIGLFIGVEQYRLFEERRGARTQLASCLEKRINDTAAAEIPAALCECGTSVSVGVKGIDRQYRRHLEDRLNFYKTAREKYQINQPLLCELQLRLELDSTR